MPGKVPYRPALFALHASHTHNNGLEVMDKRGMTTLVYDKSVMQALQEQIPDMFGMTEAQIQKQPPYIQYLKCEGKIESGEPGCEDNKYNDTICARRKAKASWHPGWK